MKYRRDFIHIRQMAPRVRVAQSYIGMVSRYSAWNTGTDLQKKMTEKLKDAIRENIICVDKQNVVLRSFTSRSPSLTKTILSIVGHFVLQKTEKRNYS